MKATRIPDLVFVVASIPTCDECEARGEPIPNPGRFDAKSIYGPWGNFCWDHFHEHTHGRLGLGLGQYLVTNDEAASGQDLPDDVAALVERERAAA